MSDNKGHVDIRGKKYRTVPYRVELFRAQATGAKGWAILTSIEVDDGKRVVVRAQISNPKGVVVATGHAEEIRGSSNINRTSAMENAETSAVGRALAAFGLGGEAYASAEEVLGAILAQERADETPTQKAQRQDGQDKQWKGGDKANFIALIGDYGWGYDALCVQLESRGKTKGRPSTWPPEQRADLIKTMKDGRFPCGPAFEGTR